MALPWCENRFRLPFTSSVCFLRTVILKSTHTIHTRYCFSFSRRYSLKCASDNDIGFQKKTLSDDVPRAGVSSLNTAPYLAAKTLNN